MKKTRKLLITCLMAFVFLGACQKEETSKNTINVYNAGEYIDQEILKDFENETGIKVIYDTFASNEDLYIKLSQTSETYDVVVPSDYMIERLIKEDKLEKIDFSKVPNFENIKDEYKNPDFDKENKYSVPYFAGTVGIIYNKTMTKGPLTSWGDLWDQDYANQIIMYNSQRDSIAVALKKLGYSLNSTNEKELEEAKKELIAQKSLVYAYLTDDGRDAIVQGDAAMMVMYSGDADYMISENSDLAYVVPKEGSNIWMDSMVIPKTTKNKEAAEKFINYMCQPEVALKNAIYCVGYTSPIKQVRDMLPEELKNSKVAYPDYEDLPELEYFRDLGEAAKLYDKVWTEVSATMQK